MAIDPDLKLARKEAARLLAEERPDRYVVRDHGLPDDLDEVELEVDVEVSDDDETAWLDAIADTIAKLIPETEVRQLYARKIVGQEEGSATRRANALLRKIKRQGQLVLDWMDLESYPVAVITRSTVKGRVRIKEERVALRAMRPEDFDTFAVEERRRSAQEFTARNDACAGAEWVAEQMRKDEASRFDDWARGRGDDE